MSLFIKGMKMPKTCQICRTAGLDRIVDCSLWQRVRSISLDKHRNCPLIEVPTPHERLVDAHAAIMLLQKYYDHVGEPLKEHAIGECIMIIKDDVPTIIEAEE